MTGRHTSRPRRTWSSDGVPLDVWASPDHNLGIAVPRLVAVVDETGCVLAFHLAIADDMSDGAE